MEYGLIGEKLGHSFSAQIHKALGGYDYTLCELPDEDAVRAFFAAREFRGVNVTIPYKKLALSLCDEVEENARQIGAVNTVINRNGRLVGYNTDFDGCRYALRHAGISLAGKNVVILGSGGTAQTFSAVAKAEGAKRILHAGRTAREGVFSYLQLWKHHEVEVVMNATPAGMYPNNGECLVNINPTIMPNLTAVFDAVYNPLETKMLYLARKRGVQGAGGLMMLVAQAKYACELFCGKSLSEQDIEKAARVVLKQMKNVVLVGMPSCGKTTLGKCVAQAMGRPFLDFDAEIERRAGKTISEIFRDDGEPEFRKLEMAVCADLSRKSGCVLSTGGGIVLREENVRNLQQCGVIIYVHRPLKALAVGDSRPLSRSMAALATIYEQRAPLYERAADRTVFNTSLPEQAVRTIQEVFYEAIDTQRP